MLTQLSSTPDAAASTLTSSSSLSPSSSRVAEPCWAGLTSLDTDTAGEDSDILRLALSARLSHSRKLLPA